MDDIYMIVLNDYAGSSRKIKEFWLSHSLV